MDLKDLLETITPEIAKDLLSRNDCPGQRNISKDHVNNWLRLMRSGQWDNFTPEPIKISENNRLLDGQHRLMAIIGYGAPVQMSVIRGCKESSFQNLDSGRKRAMGDRIILNENWPPSTNKRMIAVVNNWMMYEDLVRVGITAAETLRMYEIHKRSIDWLSGVHNKQDRMGKAPIGTGFCLSYERSPTAISNLANAFYGNTRDNKNAIALRELAISGGRSNGRSGQKLWVERTISVCRAEIEGRELKIIRPRTWND